MRVNIKPGHGDIARKAACELHRIGSWVKGHIKLYSRNLKGRDYWKYFDSHRLLPATPEFFSRPVYNRMT